MAWTCRESTFSFSIVWSPFKWCGMGPWLVLVSPCFRENEIATCNIRSFLCTLDNLLQENVIVFFFENQISKWRSFKKKKGYFDLFFTFFSHQGKVTKIPSYLTHTHTLILLTLLTFFALPILKKNTNLSGTVSLWYESWCWFLFAPFWNNQEITKWWAKCKLECLLLKCIYANAKFIVICKPRTLNDGGEDWRLS